MRPTALLHQLLLFAALAASASPAAAAHFEIQGGRSYMDSHPANTAFAEAVLASHALGDSHVRWAPDFAVGWIDGRDVPRYRGPYDTREAVWLGAAGVRLRRDGDSRWYFAEQLAGIHGRTQALSSGYQFVSTLGWQGRHLSVQLRHVSNGGLHKPNRGETMLLVGIGFGG